MDERTKAGIRSSKIFLVLGTQNYFDDIPKQEVMLAKGLKKPFRVVLDVGVKVPDWFREGVEDYKEKVVSIEQLRANNKFDFDLKAFLS